jgi:integrase
VTPIGKVRVGKPQLRIDEARRFAETALTLYTEQGDTLALAALMALLLGLRASEVLLRVARDVDDGGRILWIDGGKTHNARRHLRVPEVLQGHLQKLVSTLGPEEPLFGRGRTGQPHRRQTLHSEVARICVRSGVPKVCPHSLRGLYATLAVESGAVSDAVAASLGHGSFAMTSRHYAQPTAVRNAQTARVLDFLGGDRGEADGTPELEPAAKKRAEELLASLDPATMSQLLSLAAQQAAQARVKN